MSTSSPVCTCANESCARPFAVDLDHHGHARPQQDRRYCCERCRADARNDRRRAANGDRRRLRALRRRYAVALEQRALEAAGQLPLDGLPAPDLPTELVVETVEALELAPLEAAAEAVGKALAGGPAW